MSDTDGLPEFFNSARILPEGVTSLIGELEEKGLTGRNDDSFVSDQLAVREIFSMDVAVFSVDFLICLWLPSLIGILVKPGQFASQ